MRFEVPYVDFPAQFRGAARETLAALETVLARGEFILGEEVAAFEKEFAALCDAEHAIGVANGTDAIVLVLKALGVGPGDEVVTAPNSWISTAAAIVHTGARPVFADVGPDQNVAPAKVDAAIGPRTKALLPVHLAGRCADMRALLEIGRRRGVPVIEDAAQAVLAKRDGGRAGSMGLAACFSLHPLKNLNAAGDAGAITTNDAALAGKLRLLRNHGLVTRDEAAVWGFNSRLDALQAALLRFRMGQLEAITARRRRHAARYRERLASLVECPMESPGELAVYHLFVIQCDRRDELKAFLEARSIETKIHYPVPIHLQPAAAALGHERGDFPVAERQASRILSLPVHQFLEDAQVDRVCSAIEEFYRQ
ncbi:MAG TPA: DegT/DnrJ/EryC1/StrS family aminotransferase [Planctomycetota bacterium]|nr:DegT/DnrJ/EryC1/StrS family aminotransferase [Planctomycetota bacterium]